MRQAQKKTTKVHIKSALPIFGAAGVFLLSSLILPIYNMWAIILSAGLSAAAFLALDLKLFKGRDAVLTEEVFTGDRQFDAQIFKAQEIISRFRLAAEKSGDEKVSKYLSRIADATEGIIEDVIQDPEDRSDAATFFDYYLPTMDKLMRYYEQFAGGSFSENAQSSRQRIEGCLDMVAGAFEKFLDKLYRNDAAEIKTSIEVLKIMLRTDGLAKKRDVTKTATDLEAQNASEMDAEIENISNRLRDEANMELKTAVGTNH